jgi:FHS family L-fucose permease-like MFS transporter
MNDLLIPKFKADFDLTQFQANLIQSAFFGAFFLISLFYYLFSLKKGDLINKVGYKKCLSFGLVVCSAGCFMFFPASSNQNYPMFLLALLMLGSGVTIIQIAANPYVAILGDEKGASSRLNLAQGVNSFGYVITPVVGGYLFFGSEVYQASHTSSVSNTYVLLGTLFLVLAIIINSLRLPEFKNNAEMSSVNLFKNKTFVLGMIAIFCYVGSEVTIGSILINFLGDDSVMGLDPHSADKYLSFYWGGLMIGRLLGGVSLIQNKTPVYKYTLMAIIRVVSTAVIYGTASFKNYLTTGEIIRFDEIVIYLGYAIVTFVLFIFAGKFPQKNILIFSGIAALLISFAMYASGSVAMWAIISTGLFNSIMWSNIFTLSIKGLGSNTAKGSSLLVMMIVGGSILPAVQGILADITSIRSSLVIVIIGYLYLVFFGSYHTLRMKHFEKV